LVEQFVGGLLAAVGGLGAGRSLAGAFLPDLMHEVGEHSRSPFTVRAQSLQALTYFIGINVGIIEEGIDLLSDAARYVPGQWRLDEAAVLIEQRVAEQGGGGSGARLARYRYPSPLNYPLNYPLRSETLLRLTESLMRLSRGTLTCMF